MAERRKDSKGRVLKSGESERSDGTYMYRYTASNGKRHCVYDKTLEGLRKREDDISRNRADGIRTEAPMVTVNDIYYMWLRLKKVLGCVSEIQEVDLSNTSSILMLTRDGYTVSLGDRNRIHAKLRSMLYVREKLRELGKSGGAINVSVPESPTYSPAIN